MLFDFATIPDRDRYKLMVSCVVPRPIAWVVTMSADGAVNAAPYSFFNAMSSEPPIVAIGIATRETGDQKDTGANIRATGEFVVNLVAAANAPAMNVTAYDYAPGVDEVAKAGLTTAPSTRVKPPRIVESPVAMECEHFQTIDVSPERAIVLGRVVAMHIADEAVMDQARCYIDTPKLDLVGRMHGAGWYSRTTDRFELKRLKEPV